MGLCIRFCTVLSDSRAETELITLTADAEKKGSINNLQVFAEWSLDTQKSEKKKQKNGFSKCKCMDIGIKSVCYQMG